MICQNARLTYKPSPTGFADLDQMIPCQNEATTTRWVSRGTSREKLRHYCVPCAERSDAFRQKLRDGLDRVYAERGEEPIVFYQGDRVRVAVDGETTVRVGTVVGLPCRYWSAKYAVHLDGTPYSKPAEFYADELTACSV